MTGFAMIDRHDCIRHETAEWHGDARQTVVPM
jgi:hypothetical protein